MNKTIIYQRNKQTKKTIDNASWDTSKGNHYLEMPRKVREEMPFFPFETGSYYVPLAGLTQILSASWAMGWKVSDTTPGPKRIHNLKHLQSQRVGSVCKSARHTFMNIIVQVPAPTPQAGCLQTSITSTPKWAETWRGQSSKACLLASRVKPHVLVQGQTLPQRNSPHLY